LIKSFTKAFKTARESAGLKGIVSHDMRRSGVRICAKRQRRARLHGNFRAQDRAIFNGTTVSMRTINADHLRAEGIQTPPDRAGTEGDPASASRMNYHKTSTKQRF
jgi:hypothetical protein